MALPPQSRFCVTLVCNADYVYYALFVAWQLQKLPERNFDIIICSQDELSEVCGQHNIGFLKLEIDDFITTLPTNARLSQYAYWCLPALKTLARHYDRVLYLDTDIYVCGLQMHALFDIDMLGRPVAAVRDVHQFYRPNRVPNEFRALGFNNAPYFNTGVVLIECATWNAQKIFNQIEHYAINHGPALSCHDQSLLNLACYNNWSELSPVWNWQYSVRNGMFGSLVGVELLHLAGVCKPWSPPDGNLPRTISKTYAAYCAQMGVNTPENSMNPTQPDYKILRKHIWKTLFYSQSIHRQFERFDHDLHVIAHGSKS